MTCPSIGRCGCTKDCKAYTEIMKLVKQGATSDTVKEKAHKLFNDTGVCITMNGNAFVGCVVAKR